MVVHGFGACTRMDPAPTGPTEAEPRAATSTSTSDVSLDSERGSTALVLAHRPHVLWSTPNGHPERITYGTHGWVLETADGGWSRVITSDGCIGWLEDGALSRTPVEPRYCSSDDALTSLPESDFDNPDFSVIQGTPRGKARLAAVTEVSHPYVPEFISEIGRGNVWDVADNPFASPFLRLEFENMSGWTRVDRVCLSGGVSGDVLGVSRPPFATAASKPLEVQSDAAPMLLLLESPDVHRPLAAPVEGWSAPLVSIHGPGNHAESRKPQLDLYRISEYYYATVVISDGKLIGGLAFPGEVTDPTPVPMRVAWMEGAVEEDSSALLQVDFIDGHGVSSMLFHLRWLFARDRPIEVTSIALGASEWAVQFDPNGHNDLWMIDTVLNDGYDTHHSLRRYAVGSDGVRDMKVGECFVVSACWSPNSNVLGGASLGSTSHGAPFIHHTNDGRAGCYGQVFTNDADARRAADAWGTLRCTHDTSWGPGRCSPVKQGRRGHHLSR